MATIYELVQAKNIATYWNEKSKERKPFLLEAFFPADKQLGLELSWIKGANKSPVSLQLSAFDAKAIPLSRQGFDKLQKDMPFFKNSMNIDEKQRQELNKVINSGNQNMIDLILTRVFDDKMTLLDNADITREILRSQLITTGAISISSNGQAFSFDYSVPDANKVTVDWTTVATADPIGNIVAWQDIVETATGERPTNLVMNLATFNLIGKTDAVKNAVYVFAGGKVNVGRTAVKEYILAETGCNVWIYDKGYVNDSGVFTKFIPNNVVSLLPDMVGKTWFGTTPEESDLMNDPKVQVELVDTGVAVTTSKEVDPVNVMTKASMICMPSGEMANAMVIASIT